MFINYYKLQYTNHAYVIPRKKHPTYENETLNICTIIDIKVFDL